MPDLTNDLSHILDHTHPLWEGLRGGHVFLTGGTGFFGCWLVESFLHVNGALALNAKITVLTRNPSAFSQKMPHLAGHPALTLLQGDVRDFAFPQGAFTHIIHAANEARPEAIRQDPAAVRETIIEGTKRVLQFASAAPIEKFLYTSSGAVYGASQAERSFAETDDMNAVSLSAYGNAKREAENLCLSSGLNVAIARCFAFAGPYLPLDGGYALGDFIRDAQAGGPVRVNSDGTAMRSYLHASDLAIWLWTLLLAETPSRIYNVGSDEAISIAGLAKAVAECFEPPPEVIVTRPPAPGRICEWYVPDTTRARRELGLVRHVALREAIRSML